MFVCGFHFPAEEGNNVAFEKVVEKLDAEVGSSVGSVKEFKFRYGKKFEKEMSYSKTDTVLAKALLNFFLFDNESKEEKYMIYTDRYQMSEISKELDSDAESTELCKKFDSMDMFKLTAVM